MEGAEKIVISVEHILLIKYNHSIYLPKISQKELPDLDVLRVFLHTTMELHNIVMVFFTNSNTTEV